MPEKKSVFQLTQMWAHGCRLALWVEDSCGSTNDFSKEDAFVITDSFKLYLTDFQEHGRGRGEHLWISPEKGTALLSSWSYLLKSPPQPIAAPLIGLALYTAASQTWPQIAWNLKAPNDLYIGSKKVAGLLIEAISQADKHRLIIGLGLNCTAHPSSENNATDIQSHLQVGLGEHDSWTEFLTVLQSTFQEAVACCAHSELSAKKCSDLMVALNKNPLVADPITQVSPDGSIHSLNKIINWTDL